MQSNDIMRIPMPDDYSHYVITLHQLILNNITYSVCSDCWQYIQKRDSKKDTLKKRRLSKMFQPFLVIYLWLNHQDLINEEIITKESKKTLKVSEMASNCCHILPPGIRLGLISKTHNNIKCFTTYCTGPSLDVSNCKYMSILFAPHYMPHLNSNSTIHLNVSTRP